MSRQDDQNQLNNNGAPADEGEEPIRYDFDDFDVKFRHDDASNDDFTEVIIEGRGLKKVQEGEYLDSIVLASGVQALQSERFREKTRSVRAAQKALEDLQRASQASSAAAPSKEEKRSNPSSEAPERATASPEKAPASAAPAEKKEPFALDERDEKSDKKRSHRHSRSHSRMGRKWKRMKKWQRGIIIFLLVLLLIVVSTVASVYLMHKNGQNQIMTPVYGEAFEKSIVYNGVEYIYNKDVTSIAFIGVDRRAFGINDDLVETAGQNDVNMVLSVDTNTGKANVIVLPRDAMVDVKKYSLSGDTMGQERQQLCLAYSYGDGAQTSCENAIDAIQHLLYGIPINTYVALDMDGIAPLNDAIGGVKFTSPNDFKDKYKKGEEITITGENAEEYIRIREHTLTGDQDRRDRQVAYVKAFVSKAANVAMKNPASLTDIYNIGKEYTVTNLTLSRSLYFATNILTKSSDVLSFNNIRTLSGKLKLDDAGYAQTIVDEDEALKTVLDIYYTALQ